jgi:hypothetical protein
MNRDGVWGGDAEIEAIALVYKKQISIYINRQITPSHIFN